MTDTPPPSQPDETPLDLPPPPNQAVAAGRDRPPLPPGLAAKVRHASRPANSFVNSAGFRFGLVYAALFGASALALAAFLWWSTAGVLDRQTDAAIYADSQGLAERYADGGLPALIDTIEQRIAGNVDDDALYLLIGPNLQRITGNLAGWPAGVTMDTDWVNLRIDRAGRRGLARVHHFDIPGGFHLLVGRDVEARLHLRRLVTDAMLWSSVIAVVLGCFGAWVVRGLFRSTLSDVAATAAAISVGDLTRRVRVTGQGDEFDLLAETINDMLDRIARLMDGVRQVSNAIAHDLRTPITRARARLEDAATHARDEDDLRAAIDRAQIDLDGIVSVFQALLRIAEIEAGARRSAFAPVDAAPLLQDLAELYDAVAEEHGQTLQAVIPPDLAVFGDRDMIQQAVANLMDNALKFSPEGGLIQLRAESDLSGVRITVSDEGPGIPDDDRIRATERFFRGESARSTPGSGLGLALVQAVATLHGGTLVLEDNEPGLRAVLLLPPPDSRSPKPAPTPKVT